MTAELPVYKRCLFCLPLRYGLITWGYIRVVISILIFIAVFFPFYGILGMAIHHPRQIYTVYAVILGVILVLTLTDIILNTIFIVGGHKKNLKLLRAYYIYSFSLWVLTLLLAIAYTLYTFWLLELEAIELSYRIWIIFVEVSTLLAQTIIQVYVLLLIRSEIIKIRSNCKFRFVNDAADSECTMNYETEITDGQGVTKHIFEKATSMCVPKDKCEFRGY